ncbi:hypothetical protein AB870_24685 (plasmid) [Pandoraea faecigallinarum]|uniref:Uncharacterized protein n=2 Tax=Pandoraea faecigallinarum TaxID=656179 RepID=A0A0H3X3N6_9BURK|nr:hypothetical protein AB870_24685 [Pandoraea faecigallinarum]
MAANMSRMIAFYNREVARFNKAHAGPDKKARDAKVDDIIDTDRTHISGTRASKQELATARCLPLATGCLTPGLYHPCTKQGLVNWR